jgi:transposase
MNPDQLALLERYERQIDALERRVGELEAQLTSRDARIADLEAQLAAAQRAAKRQATPFARRERKVDPQKPGRKRGQGRFAFRAKPTPEQVTETKTALLDGCPACGGAIQDRAPQEQFQIEIPPIQPTVTRFITERGYCPACAAQVQSVHPEQISTATGAAGVVLGPRLKAFAADLHHRLGVSYGKIASLWRELFGLPITRGGLAQADARLARKARPIYEHLVELLRQSEVVHVDETGWRIGALAAWLWVFANTEITVYEIATSRGHEVVLKILGRDFAGILVADSFRAYDAAALADWLQQKCVAHLLRNLADLLERKQGRARQFAQEIMALLREALALKAGATDLRTAEYEAAATALEERLDRLLDERRRFTDSDNLRLAERLRKHRADILRFLYWAELDATNNLAERELRPAVVTRKTGGCNRTESGAQTHVILASVLATCHRQALSILDYLVKLQQFGSTPPEFAAA